MSDDEDDYCNDASNDSSASRGSSPTSVKTDQPAAKQPKNNFSKLMRMFSPTFGGGSSSKPSTDRDGAKKSSSAFPMFGGFLNNKKAKKPQKKGGGKIDNAVELSEQVPARDRAFSSNFEEEEVKGQNEFMGKKNRKTGGVAARGKHPVA